MRWSGPGRRPRSALLRRSRPPHPRRPVAGPAPRAHAGPASRDSMSPTRWGSQRETAIMTTNATGTETIAGCWRSARPPRVGSPNARPAKIAEVAISIPAHIPAAAPRAVSRDHQIPSRNIGQKVLAARANAQPTRIDMSTCCATRASSAGITIAATAAIRKCRRLAAPPGAVRCRRGQTSWLNVPANRDQQAARGREERRERAGAGDRRQHRADRARPGNRGSTSTTSSVRAVV